MEDERPSLNTRIATSDSDSITVRGRSLTDEVIGEMDFSGFLYFQLTGNVPTESESRMLNAMLVSIVEHGITPSVIASRLTYNAAPEALQGAVSSGLLGAGSVFLGSMEDCAKLLQSRTPYEDPAAAASTLLDESDGAFPGLGHPSHTPDDPRTNRLFEIAAEEGFHGDHVRLIEAIITEAEDRHDRVLPINATGAIAAVASDMGLDWHYLKGFALVSRTAGLVGHLNEERTDPMARDIWDVVEHHVEYEATEAGQE